MSGLYWYKAYLTDFLALGACVLLLLSYHLRLYYRIRLDPHYTFQSVGRMTREAWVATIMADESKNILGVQTLRNSTMAATFFASTAILLVMGTLTLSGQAEKLTTSWHQLNVLGSSHPGVWIIKVLLLLSDFLVAFFNFAMAIRLFHHVGYLLSVPADRRPPAVTPSTVALHLNRAGRHYSIGMRAYYFAVPLVFWLFGPHFMVVACVVLVVVLYHIDRLPDEEKPTSRATT